MFAHNTLVTPLQRWTQHTAPSGQPYLADPATGKTVWLYQRFHDTEFARDYIVNRITKERAWATAANAHLCPPSDTAPLSTRARPTASAKPAALPAAARPKQVPAPPSLLLGADEVLLEDAETDRRYVFNRRTRRSRWLDDGRPEPLAQPPRYAADAVVDMSPAAVAGAAAAQRAGTGSGVQRPRRGYTPKAAATDVQRAWRGFAARRPGGAADKLRRLAGVEREVGDATAAGAKHDVELLARAAAGKALGEGLGVKDADQRLMQLGEYLTQRMLVADGVETAGDAVVRARRKATVKRLLALIDRVDGLRAQARASLS